MLVAFPSDGFIELEQLIIHYTQLISPNTEHELKYSALLSMLMILLACTMIFCISDYRSHFSSLVTIPCKNFFSVSLKQQFTGHFALFDVFWLQLIRQFLCFWIIPVAFKRLEIVNRSTFNDFASSCVWLRSWSSKASTSSSSNFFGPGHSLSFVPNYLFISSKPVFTCWNRWSIITISFRQHLFQQHFSSNGSKKANCVLLAQNSTYSMLKKTILFTLRHNDTYWKLKPHNDALKMKIVTIWLNAIVLVTPSLKNPLKLMHTFNIYTKVYIKKINKK